MFAAEEIDTSTAPNSSDSKPALLEGEVKHSATEEELNVGHQHIKNRNFKKAYKHFKKLAHKGCAYSQCIVGIMHHKGVGTKKDMKQALHWFEKSAKQGWKDAEHRLGMIHLMGDGIEKNVELGVKWLEAAAKHGAFEAKIALDEFAREGKETLAQGQEWISGQAQKGMGQAKSIASQMPSVAGPAPNAAPTSDYERGLMNMQKSWTGYIDVVKNLESMSNSAK